MRDQAAIVPPISILKSLWSRQSDGRWGITDVKGLDLKPKAGFDGDYFIIESDVELMTHRPSKNIHEALASFGTTDFLMKQSIAPVVAWSEGDAFVRCIGTAAVISCSGYVMTAAHVLMDPIERGYGVASKGSRSGYSEALNFGIFIPASPAYGTRGFRFFPFEKLWLWGGWRPSPLLHEPAAFEYLTDIAICQVPEMPDGAAHQPLSLSLNPFVPDEAAYSLGYAEIDDIPLAYEQGKMVIKAFKSDLYVSIGHVMQVFPQNHLCRDVPTPGPCFDFDARIPGKMSGAPIFGAKGAVIRGVVSRSWSGDRHAYGAMLGPAMDLPLDEPMVTGRTLRSVMADGQDGIAEVYGAGL